MRKFFESLEEINYIVSGKTKLIKDMFSINESFDKTQKYRDSEDYYISYEVTDGECIEDVAASEYGDKALESVWIIAVMNEMMDFLFDFPMSGTELEKSTGYTEKSGNITSTMFDTVVELNDKKRIIKVLKKEYLVQFERDFFGD